MTIVGKGRRIASAAVWAGLIAAAAGCLFDPRDPAPPIGSEVPFLTPSEPEVVLTNLKAATEGKLAGNFQRSFTEDYKFRFSIYDAETDTLWGVDRDMEALQAMFLNTGTFDLTWEEGAQYRDLGDDRYYADLGYRLVYRRSAADSTVFAGTCYLYLSTDGLTWSIYRWVDIKGDAPLTWGYLRRNTNLEPGSAAGQLGPNRAMMRHGIPGDASTRRRDP